MNAARRLPWRGLLRASRAWKNGATLNRILQKWPTTISYCPRISTPSLQAARFSSDGHSPPSHTWTWLRDPSNPKLNQLLQNERDHFAKAICDGTFRQIESELYAEFRRRVLDLQPSSASVAERMGQFEYYMRQETGQNYPVYYRRPVGAKESDRQKEQVVLDQNAEVGLSDRFDLVTSMKVSHDAKMLLVVFEDDNEHCRVAVKEISSGKFQFLPLQQVRSVEWATTTHPRCFYFTKYDEMRRPSAVYRYNCNTRQSELIYDEPDPASFVDLSQTKDSEFVLINCNSKSTSEIHALNANDPAAKPRLLSARREGTLYFADHSVDSFYILTNEDGNINYKLVKQSDDSSRWQTQLPSRPQVKIDDIDVFRDFIVLYEREKSIPRIRICDKQDPLNRNHLVPLPKHHEICKIIPGVNREFDSHQVRFTVSTPLIPEIVYDYDMSLRRLNVLKYVPAYTKPKVFDPNLFECYRVHVTSSDNVQVPMTLMHRHGLPKNGQNPALIVGYGAYGSNLEAAFELELLSLLERGWVIALAHVRGGGENGLEWYEQGRGLAKRNTFEDFVACTKYLAQEKYTCAARTVAKGTSAGGLIMGFMANEHPELVRALVMKVPFVDIYETMQDTSLPLTLHEYDEWGNMELASVRRYVQSYAPCENVDATKKYPAMYVTGSLNDVRVNFWEPVKWVQQIRQCRRTNQHEIVLNMSEHDGHFGGGGRLDQLRQSAIEFAFLFRVLGLAPSSSASSSTKLRAKANGKNQP